MQNMVSFILLLTPLIVPSSTQTRTVTLESLDQRLEQLKTQARENFELAGAYLSVNVVEDSLTPVKSDTEDIKDQG